MQVSAAKAEVKEWKRAARAAEEERQRCSLKGPPDRHAAPMSPSWAPTSPTTPLPTLNGSARASGRSAIPGLDHAGHQEKLSDIPWVLPSRPPRDIKSHSSSCLPPSSLPTLGDCAPASGRSAGPAFAEANLQTRHQGSCNLIAHDVTVLGGFHP